MQDGLDRLRGRSRATRLLREQVRLYADSPATLLIEGETGSGKEVVARALHAVGRFRRGPFVGVDCGAIPESLFESELFGHARGAFTGASQQRLGLIASARGGTLFFDEIENLPLGQQRKILRLLEEREYRPVGGERVCRLDARFVAATNRNLRAAVEAGEVREDLLYRLEVLRIEVPPLRLRLEDLPDLLEHLAGGDAEFSLPGRELMADLRARPWRGNVRELGNIVERARALVPTVGWGEAWHAAIRGRRSGGGSVPLGMPLGRAQPKIPRIERLERALARNDWHRAATAAELGISRATLWRHMRDLGIRRREAS